ncbi:NADH-quinone oxidoreductase subunit J, partial [Staphylococcus aureus]|uniref:NADH-quinone oxidoreductase subunit J n=1 Tax=Staphylococcus aureus TaxID=1280 RepID=UPI0009913A57
MIQLLAFYLFAFVVCASGAMTILSRNPVHSVLWLILAFFNAAGLMVLANAAFIAMLLVIVYVGAVAVLFLFVVMMLNIDFAELRAGVMRYAAVGVALAVALVAEILIAVGAYSAGALQLGRRVAPVDAKVPNIEAIGQLL